MPPRITVETATAEGWYRPNTNGGYCECGCGELAPIATESHRARGHVGGEPMRFRPGHGLCMGRRPITTVERAAAEIPRPPIGSPGHERWMFDALRRGVITEREFAVSFAAHAFVDVAGGET